MLATFFLLLILVFPPLGWTQGNQFFTCTRIHYFDDCLPHSEGTETRPAQPPDTASEHLTAETAPKWTPNLMSPDTPPLAIQMLKDPSAENAREFAIWHIQRFIDIFRAQEAMTHAVQTDELAQELRRRLEAEFGYQPDRHERDLPILKPAP